ncbi:methyl-accepting chemotaxis protein [Desulfovibrio sp. OttesenSCG-928-A18]|nr:methyl-accepting chemotaxis protein [Desulfovibrio sp. OttesenSCG-928-A18]
MTTKYKIISGFVIMILLTGIVAALGYVGLQRSSNGFLEYQRQARVNVLASDMVGKMNQIVSDINGFTTSEDPKLIQAAIKELGEIEEMGKEAQQFMRIPENRKLIESMIAEAGSLKGHVSAIQSEVEGVVTQYENVVQPAAVKFAVCIDELAGTAIRVSNVEALSAIIKVLEGISPFRAAVGRLVESREVREAELAAESFKTLSAALAKVEGTLTTESGRKLFADAKSNLDSVQSGLNEMLKRCDSLRERMALVDKIGHQMVDALTKLNASVDKLMKDNGEMTLDANSKAQNFTLMVSGGAIIAGIALAMLIILGIIKVLNELARFANATASGDFDYAVKVREKGEIGSMVQAMQNIPVALKNILADYQKLEKEIEFGQLEAQGDPSKFSGGFSTLVRGTNAILNRFRMVLENIPSPVVMLDKELKASYINVAAREVAGADYKGKTCMQLFGREDFNTDSCGMRKAVETKRPANAETVAHPQGKVMDISYTAIPMLDEKGNLASVLQLITDLTAIKSTQRTIMQVAAEASEISNRVAAASEELSAQVEQVSRGAEMQRSRVESTASAMTQMNSTVLEVARSAGQASEQSELTRQKAQGGAELVNKVVSSINMVNAVSLAMEKNMQELGQQAESIGGVMNVISDIADQTNLLALNAAIEAARAGEAGRGFAVVADEVRKLAEKTMTATQEVGSNITAIQQSTRKNIEEMGNAAKGVSEATALAQSSGEALSEIVDLASSNSSVVTSIATAAEEQSATSEEINHSIDEINRIVGETSEGMIQSSSAVQELSRMAQELRRVMEKLR